MAYRVGEPGEDFSLNIFGGGTGGLSSNTKVTLLSFLDINTGWDWLKYLRHIYSYTDNYITSTMGLVTTNVFQLIPVIFDESGGTVNTSTITTKYLNDSFGGTISFQILMDSIWSTPCRANLYRDGISGDPDFTALGATQGRSIINYILSNDYLITDKWTLESTALGHPISFKHYNNYVATLELSASPYPASTVLTLTGGISGATGNITIDFASGSPDTYTYSVSLSHPNLVSVFPDNGSVFNEPVPVVLYFDSAVAGTDNDANYSLDQPGFVKTLTVTDSTVTNIYNSADIYSTTAFIKQRLVNLLNAPAIVSTDPPNGSTIDSLSSVKVVFSKPVEAAAADTSGVIDTDNFPPSGGGLGSVSLSSASYTGINEIENVATLTFGAGTLSDSPDTSITITPTNIVDTDATTPVALTDNITYTADLSVPGPDVTVTCTADPADRHHPDTPISVTFGAGATHWNITHTTGSVPATPDPANAALWTALPGGPSLYTLPYADNTYRIYVFAKNATNGVGSGYVEIDLELWRDCVVVMDCSESMNHPPADTSWTVENKNILADQAVKEFFTKLHELYIDTDPYAANDRYGLVNYSSTAIVTTGSLTGATALEIAPLESYSSEPVINGVVEDTPPMLATAIGSGIANALHMLQYSVSNAEYNRLRFVFLFADGEQNIQPYTNPGNLDPATDTSFQIDTNHANAVSAGCDGFGVFNVNQNDIRVNIHTFALDTYGSWTERLHAISNITGGSHYVDEECYPITDLMETEISDSLYYGSSPQIVANMRSGITTGSRTMSFGLNKTVKRALFCLSWLGDEDLTFIIKKGNTLVNVLKKDIIDRKNFLYIRVDFPHSITNLFGVYESFLDRIKDSKYIQGEMIVSVLKENGVDLHAADKAGIDLKLIAYTANTFNCLSRAGMDEKDITGKTVPGMKVLKLAGVTSAQLQSSRKYFEKLKNCNISVKSLMQSGEIMNCLAEESSINDIISNREIAVNIFKRKIFSLGEWKMIISKTNPSNSSEIKFYASVIAEDKMIKYSADLAKVIFTGNILELAADFLHPQDPYINKITVEIEANSPSVCSGNVAYNYSNLIKPVDTGDQSIPHQVYSQLYSNKESAAILRKRSIQNIKLKPAAQKSTISTAFKGSIRKTTVPGIYKIKYSIKGTGKELEYFERVLTKTVVVYANPDLKYSIIKHEFQAGSGQAVYTVIPRDKFKNIIGPGFKNSITVENISNKTTVIKDTFNGSYRIEIPCKNPEEYSKLKPKIKIFGKIIFTGEKRGCLGLF